MTSAKLKIKTLKLEQLRIDGGTQLRSLCESTVKDYAEAYEEAVDMPPIRACFDGADYWVYDGFHRYHASRRVGLATIKVEVAEGTQRDAVLLACGVNTEHGLRRSNADKHRIVEKLLTDSEWGKWSDRKLADSAGVSPQFVANIRAQVPTVGTSNDKRVGTDGKSYPATKPKKEPPPPVKSPKEQLAEFFGETPEPETPEEDEEPTEAEQAEQAGQEDLGICPNCGSKKWAEDEFGVSCAKCKHPHGEPRGDVDSSRVGVQRSKTVKTVEALMRAFDDLQGMQPNSRHVEAIDMCKGLLAIAKGWK